MNEAGITDPYAIGRIRDLGVIDLPTIQKKLKPTLHAFTGSIWSRSFNKCRKRVQRWDQGAVYGTSH
jgi:hypothetical protein